MSLQKDILELREKKAIYEKGGGDTAIEKQMAMGKLILAMSLYKDQCQSKPWVLWLSQVY